LTRVLKGRPEELPDTVNGLLERMKETEKALAQADSTLLVLRLADQIRRIDDVAGVTVNAAIAPEGTTADQVRAFTTEVRGKLRTDRPAIIVTMAQADGRVSLCVGVNPVGVSEGLSASDVLRELVVFVDGKGGGKPDFAQGSGANPEGLNAAIEGLDDIVRRLRPNA
jgi:alanyl-tRNA synthetase